MGAPVLLIHALIAYSVFICTMPDSDYPINRMFIPITQNIQKVILDRFPCFSRPWSVTLTSLYFGVGGLSRIPFSARWWPFWGAVILLNIPLQLWNLGSLIMCP